MTEREQARREARRRLADVLADELDTRGELDSERVRAKAARALRGLELTRWERASALDDAGRAVRRAMDNRRRREAVERANMPAAKRAIRAITRTQSGGSRIMAVKR